MENNKGCELCNIRECGTSYPEHLQKGWKATIKKYEGTNFVSLIISSDSEYIDFPIGYCPNCGREL